MAQAQPQLFEDSVTGQEVWPGNGAPVSPHPLTSALADMELTVSWPRRGQLRNPGQCLFLRVAAGCVGWCGSGRPFKEKASFRYEFWPPAAWARAHFLPHSFLTRSGAASEAQGPGGHTLELAFLSVSPQSIVREQEMTLAKQLFPPLLVPSVFFERALIVNNNNQNNKEIVLKGSVKQDANNSSPTS